MNKVKVTLVGEREVSWAIRTDLQLAKEALRDRTILVHTGKTNFLHCVWPNEYYKEYKNIKKRNKFVAVFQGNPIRLFESSPSFFEFCRGIRCVAQTREAYEILKSSPLPHVYYVPYISDEQNFFNIAEKKSLRDKYNLPQDKFIICNFFRDSLGEDLNKFKPEKGGDIFCAILYEAEKILGKGKIHVLLAGARRHAILKRLDFYNIGYTYIGKRMAQDDSSINIQNTKIINELYNASDLLLVTSRSEGAPRAILEAATVKLPILSTPVGLANDLLDDNAIIEGLTDGTDKLIQQITTGYLYLNVNRVYEKMVHNHSVESVGRYWNDFYQLIQKESDLSKDIIVLENTWGNLYRKIKRRYRIFLEGNRKLKCKSVCIWYNSNKDAIEYVKSIENILNNSHIRIYKNDYSFSGIHIILTANIDDVLRNKIVQIKNSKIILFLLFNSFAKSDYIDNVIAIGEKMADRVIWQSYLSWNQYRYFFDCNLLFFPVFSLEFSKLENQGYEIQTVIERMKLKTRKYKSLKVIFAEDLPQEYEDIFQENTRQNERNVLDNTEEKKIYIVYKDAYQDPNLSLILSMDIPIVFFESNFNNGFFSVLSLKYSNKSQLIECLEEVNETYEVYSEITCLPSASDINKQFLKTLIV